MSFVSREINTERQHYIIGLTWTEWTIREQFRSVLGEEAYSAFFNTYMDSYIAEADIAFLAKTGFNFVRLPSNYRHFESDLAPGQSKEDGSRKLDNVVSLCRKHGIWVLLDLHAAPRAQVRDQNAGSAYGEVYFWKYKHFIGDGSILCFSVLRNPSRPIGHPHAIPRTRLSERLAENPAPHQFVSQSRL